MSSSDAAVEAVTALPAVVSAAAEMDENASAVATADTASPRLPPPPPGAGAPASEDGASRAEPAECADTASLTGGWRGRGDTPNN